MQSGALVESLVVQPPVPTSTRPPIVEARDLRVRFGSHIAVGGVSFALRGGDLLGLIGPNGAGRRPCCGRCAGYNR